MGLKRKRSSCTVTTVSTIDSDITTDSSNNAIWSYYQQQKPTSPLYEKQTWSFPTYDDSSAAQYMNSRTRKRHRDDRPDEEHVHANTISRLFQAQRTQPDAAPLPPSQGIPPASVAAKTQKSTLHSFWSLPAAPIQDDGMDVDMPPSTSNAVPAEALRCDDCDTSLRSDDAMIMDDMMMEQDFGCIECRKRVCDICAVRGNDRICLGCANGR